MNEELLVGYRNWAVHRKLLRAKTIQDYIMWITHAESWLIENLGTSLAEARNSQLLLYMDTRQPTASSHNAVRCALSSFFDYLMVLGARKKNPAARIPRLRAPKKLPKPINPNRVDPMIAAARDKGLFWEALLVLYFFTGLRRDEVRLLEWKMIAGRNMYLIQKGGGERVVKLHRRCRDVLARWQPECPSDRWVFPSPVKPNVPVSHSWVWRRVRDLGASVGIEGMRPHRCRYTWAKKVLTETNDILLVQKALGHASLTNTLIYLELVEDDDWAEVIDGIDYPEAA